MPEETTQITREEAEKKILENAANPAQSYEIDGEKTTLKDPTKQLDALDRLSARSAARNPLGALRFFRLPGGTGLR